MWGVFEDEEGIVHIVPINEDEEPCVPHILSQHCPCSPQIDVEDGEVVLVHEQVH